MEEVVDILVTTYNTNEKFLKKQIESILKQTYKNIQIYISDDNSNKEEIKEILKQYEKEDERIKLYLQPKNLGYNKNYEFLLQQSTANYVMFSDHDDVWHKDKVEKSLKNLKEKNVDMIYCNCRQIDEDGIVLRDDYFKYKNVPLIKGKSKLAISRCEGIDYIEEELFDYRLHNSNVFGGRSLNQNLNKWKEKNGKSYEAFLKYREDAIKRAYDGGIKMCEQYANNKKDLEFCQKAKKYYEKIYKTKKINIRNIIEYFEILSGRNQVKKMIREIALFHFPIISYLKYRY